MSYFEVKIYQTRTFYTGVGFIQYHGRDISTFINWIVPLILHANFHMMDPILPYWLFIKSWHIFPITKSFPLLLSSSTTKASINNRFWYYIRSHKLPYPVVSCVQRTDACHGFILFISFFVEQRIPLGKI